MHSRKWTVSAIAAIVGVMTGCGGGDAGVRPETYPTPLVGAGAGVERANPHAHDLGEHWRAPQTLTRSLGASDPAGGTAGLATALDAAGERISRASSMRSIGASAMTPIGARGAIGVGRWTAGPADTLDIDFHFDAAPALTPADRARMERAGKMWSYHLLDDFEVHTTAPNTVVIGSEQIPATTIEAPTVVDDVLVVVTTTSEGRLSHGGVQNPQLTDADYEPRLGLIHINTGQGHQRQSGVLVHEIGHVLGFIESVPGGFEIPTIERYLSEDRQRFEGPASMRANGGEPVPFQWVDANGRRVAPGTSGATIDPGHPDVCTSVMSYCRDQSRVKTPSALDLAWLDDVGYELNDSGTASQPEVYGYGAWAVHSAWGVGVARHLSGFEAGEDRLEASADAFGVAPLVTLEDAVAAGTLAGSATWRGVLLGVDIASGGLAPVSGDAALSVDIDTFEGSATFDNLMVHVNGQAASFRSPRLEYAVGIDGNGFSDVDERVEGGFYGPGHEEMAGVVHDTRSGVNLLAGFGGVRE